MGHLLGCEEGGRHDLHHKTCQNLVDLGIVSQFLEENVESRNAERREFNVGLKNLKKNSEGLSTSELNVKWGRLQQKYLKYLPESLRPDETVGEWYAPDLRK